MRALPSIFDMLIQQLREVNKNVPNAAFDRMVVEVTNRVRSEPPPKIVLVGESGVGKSSTINALFNAGMEVGHVKATTKRDAGIELVEETVEGSKGLLQIYDMPGLGESMMTRNRHLTIYGRVLKDADVALWILDAQYRAMEQVQKYLSKSIWKMNPQIVDRMVFALNKVDLIHPGDWVHMANLPSEEQEGNIRERILDVRRLILEALPTWHGTIVGYSATKRYNLPQLFASTLDAVSSKRQWVLAEQMALADFLVLVDIRLLPPQHWPHRRPTPTNVEIKTRAAEQLAIEDVLDGLTDEELSELITRQKEKRQRI